MEKKLNSSKLQRIVSMRNKDVDDNDTTAINSAKLAKITNSNLITTTPIISNTNTFSTQHDILKYSSSSSQQQQQQQQQSSSKQLGITKRHLTSSLNNINLESEKITSYPSANTSLSRKIVVSSSSSASSTTNSKEDTIIDLKTNTSFPPQHQQQHQTNAIKPVRKIAVVNGTIKKSM